MRIMFVNTLYSPYQIGGAEKSVQLLAEKIIELGHECSVISIGPESGFEEINGVKVYYTSPNNLYWMADDNVKLRKAKKIVWHTLDIQNPFMKKTIEKIIGIEMPDIIHTNNLTGFSIVPWIVAKEKKIPVIHTLRDYSLMCPKGTMYRKNMNCTKICSGCKVFSALKRKKSLSLVDMVVGNSEFIVNRHKDNGFFQGIPYKRIFNGSVPSSKLVRTHNDPKERMKYLFLGRVEKEKGAHHLINTFINFPQADLYIAGRISDAEIEQKIKKNEFPDNIHFLGFINPQEMIRSTDAVIVSSIWHEPLARAVMEAYSYGKPVIATNRGGNMESVIEGRTGFIYDPDDQNGLLNILHQIENQPFILEEMMENILSEVDRFDINLTVSNYVNTYRTLLIKNSNSISIEGFV
ncbi:glycosyltransferase family 4 protein [Paenibacillus sp. D51F]